METLSLGKHNPKLIDMRKAIDHGALTLDGLLPIEGRKLIEEALRSGITIDSVFKRKDSPLPDLPPAIHVYELDAAVFKTIQSTETSQGVIALIRPRRFGLTDLLSAGSPLIVVLARLQDPGNVGTIVRVAESFGAAGCAATVGTASPFNSKTIRASAGSLFRLPHVWDLDRSELFSALRASYISIVGTSPSADETIMEWDWRKPSAVVIGNEGGGLSEEEVGLCDTVLRIPQAGAVESLNSAIAAAVIMYEAYSQRMR